jgi:RNA polymerase sigma-70 factor, ECF subfamily
MIPTSTSVISSAVGAMSDAELVGAMCGGHEEAVHALFNRYARLVYRIAANILRDPVEAEDSTQEIFLEIYRKASLYDPARGPVRAWLARYACRRALRRKLVLGRRAAYRGEPIELADERRQNPPRLTREECRWVLRSGLAHLTERQRITVELTCFEELSFRDIAERLGVSVGSTRHHYYRGLARLQHWARVTDGCRRDQGHVVSRVDTVGAARGRARPRLAPA